jgi:hypothetical protein
MLKCQSGVNGTIQIYVILKRMVPSGQLSILILRPAFLWIIVKRREGHFAYKDKGEVAFPTDSDRIGYASSWALHVWGMLTEWRYIP